MKKRTKKTSLKQVGSEESPLQIPLDKLELMMMLQASVEDFVVKMGLEFLRGMLFEDVEQLCGTSYSRGAAAYRHGSQSGVVLMGGANHSIDKPRVRSRSGKEIPLPTYELLRGKELLSQECMNRMVLGVSTRNYSEVINAAQESFGVSKGSVSREFIKGSKQALAALSERDFSQSRFPVIMIDGIEFASEVVVAAVGIDEQGHKHILGLHQGATENAEVVASLLTDLTERGIATSKPTLFVIDGSKALSKCIRKFWGDSALIQRCTLHKKRNILGHLNDTHKQVVNKMFDQALAEQDATAARKKLSTLLKYLKRISPSAANSLLEAWDHLLTVHELQLPELLRKSLLSTNIIESAFSVAREASKNVKRWRQGDMRLRWAAAGLTHAEKRFRRVRGYKHIQLLTQSIERLVEKRKGLDHQTIAA